MARLARPAGRHPGRVPPGRPLLRRAADIRPRHQKQHIPFGPS